MNHAFKRKCFVEVIGTYLLAFCGTGAVVIDQQTNGAITHTGIAITFGPAVMSLIYEPGDISGVHMNPAGSIGAALVSNHLNSSLIYMRAPVTGIMLPLFKKQKLKYYEYNLPGDNKKCI